MKFKAIITEIKQKRTASQDNEFSLKLVTEDNQIMALSAYESDTLFEVIIEDTEYMRITMPPHEYKVRAINEIGETVPLQSNGIMKESI